MRATEFLLEYNRQITARIYGKKLYDRAKKDRAWNNFFYQFPESKYLEPEQQVEKIIASLEQADPTPNKEYVPWIVKTYINDTATWLQDIYSTVKEYLYKFHKLKQKRMLEYPRSDINKYLNFGDFLSVVDEYADPFKQQQLVKGEYKVIYDDAVLRAIVPETQDAACYYGQGTRWCTAATRGKNYFSEYHNESPLLIILPKEPQYPGEKYQLHFIVTLGDHMTIRNNRDEEDMWANYSENYIIDNYDDQGQFKNEKDQTVKLSTLGGRFGQSFANAVSALAKYDPSTVYAIKTNYQSAGIK